MQHTAGCNGVARIPLRVLESDVVSSHAVKSHLFHNRYDERVVPLAESTKDGGAARCRVERGRLHTRATSISRQRCHSADSGCVESLCARAHTHTHTQLLQPSTFALISRQSLRHQRAHAANDWSRTRTHGTAASLSVAALHAICTPRCIVGAAGHLEIAFLCSSSHPHNSHERREDKFNCNAHSFAHTS
jgi:hypothetical protein